MDASATWADSSHSPGRLWAARSTTSPPAGTVAAAGETVSRHWSARRW